MLTWRGLILYRASSFPWRLRSSIKEKLKHFSIAVVREVDLSCQTYGDDKSQPVQLARSLRLIHLCNVEVWIFQVVFRFSLSIFPSRYFAFFTFHFRSHFTLDVYFAAILSQSLGQRSANRDYLLVIFS